MHKTDLAYFWSEVQGADGPGMGADLDMECSCNGVIQTHLPIPIPGCHNALPQLHGGARDPARVRFSFGFSRPQHSPYAHKGQNPLLPLLPESWYSSQ